MFSLRVVHHGRAAQHAVPAGPALPVTVEREGEAVGGLHRTAAHAQVADPLPQRLEQIDVVARASHEVVVVARHRVVDRDPAGGVHPEIPRAPLQVFLELPAGDPHRAQRVVVGIEGQDLSPADGVRVEAGPEVEYGAGGEISPCAAALYLEHEILQRRGTRARIADPKGDARVSNRLLHPCLDRDMARLRAAGPARVRVYDR